MDFALFPSLSSQLAMHTLCNFSREKYHACSQPGYLRYFNGNYTLNPAAAWCLNRKYENTALKLQKIPSRLYIN